MDAPTRSLGPPNEYFLGLSEPPDGPPPSEGPVQNVGILSIPATPVLLSTHNTSPEGDPLSSVQGSVRSNGLMLPHDWFRLSGVQGARVVGQRFRLVPRLADDTGQVLVGKAHVPLARSLGRHVLPPLRPGAPIGQHTPLARPAALHRHGHALIAAVQAAAPRGQETAFVLSVVGVSVKSVVSNHRAPLRGRIVVVIYPTGARSARRVAGAEVRRARASPAAAAPSGTRSLDRACVAQPDHGCRSSS